ncbi:hypothetical protein [Candidatus Blastococcus massiliensis]|uniref:hypothetical protein n=1 Tax=Candidatus Blastococcus massiliensis TaxID=1470358 RepID=UPI0012DD8809|nr:hypothetical protein [Candidatus Blastococcus massiliensis]
MTEQPPGQGRDPWADPDKPYAGPPPQYPPPQYPPPQHPAQYPPAQYGGPPPGWQQPYGAPAPWGQPAWGAGPYGAPWGPPRAVVRTPGQVIAAAVLAFVQAVVVLVASLYVWFFASIADIASSGRPDVYTSATARQLATEGTILAIIQLVSAVLLVAGGLLALNKRTSTSYRVLAGAHIVQVLLALYWAGRLLDVLGDLPGQNGEGALAAFSLFFLAGPAVALGLLLTTRARHWFTAPPA